MVALKFTALDAELRRRGSDRLVNLPIVEVHPDDVYVVGEVFPDDPTPAQFDDLAVRLSMFLEDAHRCHVDRRCAPDDALAAVCVPLSVPILHREKLRAAQARDGWLATVEEHEVFCMLYLAIPHWRAFNRPDQVSLLDDVARRHGLRCVEHGVIPGP